MLSCALLFMHSLFSSIEHLYTLYAELSNNLFKVLHLLFYFWTNCEQLSIQMSLENKSGNRFMEKPVQVWNLWKGKVLMLCQCHWRGTWFGSLHFSYSSVVHEQKYAKKMRQTLISKELKSGRIFNVYQQVLLKTGEKEGLGWTDTSLANKCKCREDIYYIIV